MSGRFEYYYLQVFTAYNLSVLLHDPADPSLVKGGGDVPTLSGLNVVSVTIQTLTCQYDDNNVMMKTPSKQQEVQT